MLLSFPSSTEVNKRIPKQKFYDNLDISPALKKSFVEQIQAVYWRNKLATSTINLNAGLRVTELEVFEIELTSQELDEAVLRQIDKQIPYHILFVLSYGDKSKLMVCFKEAAESGSNAFKVNRYFSTPWVNREDAAIQLKGLDLDTVLDNIIKDIGNIQIEDGNTLGQQIEIDAQREQIAKEIARLEKLARKEAQPRRKLELVQKIQKLKVDGGVL